ncbi:MAG: CPBP family intramembrane metalloprotease [Nitrospirae bacterium]|nr:CPBP family intramembrane metalloprotease [Nitrospirota bacterium]MBF0590648.1 CPBP family intramembrane metalloprotease [Nitrospirota bacterium]
MKIKILSMLRLYTPSLSWFVVVLSLCLVQQVYSIRFLFWSIPAALYLIPAYYLRRLPMPPKSADILLGVLGCVFFVLPFVLIKVVVLKGSFAFPLIAGAAFPLIAGAAAPPLVYILTLLMVNALPEELFFRGYLQESLGNGPSSVVIVSVLFALCHSGRFLISGDVTPLLTFFPSLMMGWLYLKTSNILPSTLFHLVANLAFTSIR